MKRSVICTLAVFSVAAPLTLMVVPASAAVAARPYDFDGNGYPDLAVGAPGLRINAVRNAGGVIILPASASGLSLTEMIISQSSPGVPGGSEPGDRFGYAVTSADFDRDGYADLAVGQPGEAIGRMARAGSVTVIYGSGKGLNTTRSVGIVQPGGAVASAEWGYSLVTGDFNLDNYPDLAVGAPGDDLELIDEERVASGSVRILPGAAGGLSPSGATVLRRQAPDPEWGAIDVRFGEALAAGDLDRDGDADVVVGAHGYEYVPDSYDGSVSYCASGAGGPTGCRRLLHSWFFAGLTSLAVGNMFGDSVPEIAVGAPHQEGHDSKIGLVSVLKLTKGPSVSVAEELQLSQDNPGIPGADEDLDRFGHSLASGDIDRDGYADLVIGAPGEDGNRGRATVVHGGAAGWRTSGNYAYSQNTPRIPGGSERGDRFGGSLALLDHNRDGRLDLTIGAPGENGNAGAITTLRGSGVGFTTSGSRTFGLATLGYRYPTSAGFGKSLGQLPSSGSGPLRAAIV